MKKVIFYLLGVSLMLFGFTAFADELRERELLLKNTEWEFNYCRERMITLQARAKVLQRQIAAIRRTKLVEKEKAAKEREKKQTQPEIKKPKELENEENKNR